LERLWSDLQRVLVPMYVEFRRRLTTLAIAEKDDKTLLTEADIVVEQAIVSLIREYDGSASIVAEESGTSVYEAKRSGADPNSPRCGRRSGLLPLHGAHQNHQDPSRVPC
jgi:hypothetical protein